MILIKVKELFEPKVLREKRRRVITLFKDIFSRKRSLSDARKGRKELCYQLYEQHMCKRVFRFELELNSY